MRKRNAHLFSNYFVVALILIGLVGLMGCSETPSKTDGTMNDDEKTGLISALDAYDQAKSEIQDWNNGFRIARIHHFGTSEYAENAKETSWEFYVESADGEVSTDFTYTVGSGITKATDTPYSTGRNTCLPEEITVDSTEAAAIALTAIKTNQFPNFDGGCKAELLVNENGTPYWEITANSQRKDGSIDLNIPAKYGYVEINAKTGEVITVTGDTS